jgi:hypothetical protein
MATTKTLLTLAELASLPEQEGVFRELDKGRADWDARGSVTPGRIQLNATAALPG